MFTCDVCNRKFKTMQALGGHKRSHPQGKPGAGPASANPLPVVVAKAEPPAEPPQAPPAQPERAEDEQGIMDTIREYKMRGYSARQLKGIGYARQTVDQVYLENEVPEGKPEENPQEGEHGENDELPVVTRGTEIITPEGILKRLANGSDDWALRLEGMMLLRAAQRMNRDDIEMSKLQSEAYASMIKPTLELMEKNREAQDAAAARARESSLEIADRAAFGVAQDMKGTFSSELQALKASFPGTAAEPANPLIMAMTQAIQPYLGQIMGQVFAGMFKGRVPQTSPYVAPQTEPGTAEQPGTANQDSRPLWMRPEEEDQWTEA